MAYTIISQNNTTTTLSDENGNVITVPARVTLATSTDYTIKKVNNNSVDLESGDGKIIRGVPACVVLAGEGGGGGGSVDYAKTVQRAETMPTADASNAGQQFLYSGESDATYTHGYIYENVKTATYTGTVTFEAATLSETTVTCSGDNFAAFLTEAGADPTPIVSGTMTFEADANGWRLVGKDSNDNTVTTFIEYVEDYEDAGFTFTGTPQDNDVIAFTCTVEEASSTYTWTRIDVQPTPSGLPDQTGYSGRVLGTDGFVAGWIVPEQVQRSTMPQASEDELGNIYQFTGTTDANYTNGYFYKCVSDGGNPATYSWTAVQVQASSGGLPSQTGNAGKFLTTDGTDASWSDKPLVNNATGERAVVVGVYGIDRVPSHRDAISFGTQFTGSGGAPTQKFISVGAQYFNTNPGLSSISIGSYNATGNYVVAIQGTTSANLAVSIGQNANVSGAYSVALGPNAVTTATNAVQFNCSASIRTNSTQNTYMFGNANGNFEMMDANGNLPADRLASTTGLADGNYRLRLVMASGVPTLEWVAE